MMMDTAFLLPCQGVRADGWMFYVCNLFSSLLPLGEPGISEHLPAQLAQPRQVTAFWGKYPTHLLLF